MPDFLKNHSINMANMNSGTVGAMEGAFCLERESALGGLFQQIVNEMKNTAPYWDDFLTKSNKLHSCLRATIQAVGAFLEAFQKIADAATSTRGATKDIGTALTRICLRHKAMEAKLKSFTSSIMDCLIIPLQKRLEEWNKTTGNLDKEYGKEYKRARAELKKRTIETLRLQKKLRKGGLHNGSLSSSFHGTLPRSHGGGTSMIQSALAHNGSDMGHQGNSQGGLNRTLESSMRDQTEKRQILEDVGKQALRAALTEERSRFCLFVSYLKPVVEEEVAMLYELQHVQEAMAQLEKNSGDPYTLPAASEQVIADTKGESGAWSFQTPPSSPSSLGSRKSSMCSISSANSSSSSSAHSPSHNVHNRTLNHQPMSMPSGSTRFSSVSSQDSGFVSQDTLYSRMSTPLHDAIPKPGNQSEGSNTSSTASSNSSTPSSPYPPGQVPTTNSTWPNLQETIQFERAACAIMNDRPHTISSAYERGHQRPPLTVYTFQPPADTNSHTNSPVTPTPTVESQSQSTQGKLYQAASEIYGILRGKTDAKPPVPKRGSSLERPGGSNSSSSGSTCSIPKPPRKINSARESANLENSKPMPHVPDFNPASDDMIVPQPVYVNMHELNQMASAKLQRQSDELPPPPPELMTPQTKTEAAGNNGSMNNETSGHYARGLSDDCHSIAPSDVTLEGEVDMHVDKYETASCVSSHVPLTTDDFRVELESMIGSMSSCSVSEQTLMGYDDADAESISGVSSVQSFGFYDNGRMNYRTSNGNCINEHFRNDNGDWRNRVDWCNKNGTLDPCGDYRNNNGTGRSNFLLHGRHHSMYVSNGSSFNNATDHHRGSYSSISANMQGGFSQPDSAPPSSLPISVATIHRRLANPRMPIFDAQQADKTEQPDAVASSPHMGMQRNNSLPRPHSYAAPQNQNTAHHPQMSSGSNGTLSRRNSCGQQEKPPPPRRNSSISSSARSSPVPTNNSNIYGNSQSCTMTQSQSSMNNTEYQTIQRNSNSSHPMQPIFIKNPQYSYVSSTNSVVSSQGSYDSGETTPHASMESLPPPPAYLINEQNATTILTATAEDLSKRLSVADTVRTLTQKNHQPVSPNMVRRANSMKQPGEECRESRSQSQTNGRRGSASSLESSKQRASLMQVLNQKLAQHQTPYSSGYPPIPPQKPTQPIYHQATSTNHPPQPIYSQVYQPQPIYQQVNSGNGSMGNNASPRHPRRLSEELLKNTATFVQNRVLGSKTPPPVVTSKEIFVQTLNAKLSQMRPSPNEKKVSTMQHPQMHNSNGKASSHSSKHTATKGSSTGEISRAFRVRQWITSKTVPDPVVCRDSLMDQIRRGTKLRTTRAMNDRSAPRIH